MKEWSIKLSTLLTILSILGATIIGGIAFGELRGGVLEHEKRLSLMEQQVASTSQQINELTRNTAEISTDLKWIRALIEGYAIRVHELEDHKKDDTG